VTHLLGAEAARVRADGNAHTILADGLLAELSQQLNVQLDLGQPLEQGTGVVAETLDGHRTYDNTMEARLDRWQETLRAPVYRLLMGESL
jgi:vacuolar-type H+-ATPase subunit E/Vma4